jgi:hypothetical protein
MNIDPNHTVVDYVEDKIIEAVLYKYLWIINNLIINCIIINEIQIKKLIF